MNYVKIILEHNYAMTNPNYVCTICSQTFTRKWRGTMHNSNMHAGLAQIVRLIDYMIGRCNGEYIPSDPSLYRRKRKSGELNEHQRPLLDKRMRQESNFYPSGPSLPPARIQQQYYAFDSRLIPDPLQQFNEVTIKTAELKKSLRKYLPPEEAQKTLSSVYNYCTIMGDYRPLNKALELASENVKLKEALDYLKTP